jgi:hypothetical protein
MMLGLGFKLTSAAFDVFVRLFSSDGSDTVPFELFVKRLGGGVVGESHALGMPSDLSQGQRIIPAPPREPRPPPSLSPYGVSSSDPVELVRYKLGQRSAKVNSYAIGARRRTRDEFQRLDTLKTGLLTVADFLAVLEKLFNLEMSESDWEKFAAKHAGGIVSSRTERTPPIPCDTRLTSVLNRLGMTIHKTRVGDAGTDPRYVHGAGTGEVNYKKFLTTVLDPNLDTGAFALASLLASPTRAYGRQI